MQREIKFRAWDMDENKMIYPTLQHNEKFVMQLNCSYMGEFNGKSYDTVKMPIMQFTGLHDDSGKEIYEADKVNTSYGEFIVEWNDDTCKFQFSNGMDINDNEMYGMSKFVIGNIYEQNKA